MAEEWQPLGLFDFDDTDVVLGLRRLLAWVADGDQSNYTLYSKMFYAIMAEVRGIGGERADDPAESSDDWDEFLRSHPELGAKVEKSPPWTRAEWGRCCAARRSLSDDPDAIVGFVGRASVLKGAPVSTREVSDQINIEAELPEKKGLSVWPLLALLEAAVDGRIVRLVQVGHGTARWAVAGSPVPDGYRLFEDPHAAEDAAALRTFQEAAKSNPGKPLGVRDLVPGASLGDKVRLAHALGRAAKRGHVREVSSNPNQWVMADG